MNYKPKFLIVNRADKYFTLLNLQEVINIILNEEQQHIEIVTKDRATITGTTSSQSWKKIKGFMDSNRAATYFIKLKGKK